MILPDALTLPNVKDLSLPFGVVLPEVNSLHLEFNGHMSSYMTIEEYFERWIVSFLYIYLHGEVNQKNSIRNVI